jgi:hypothetical protein
VGDETARVSAGDAVVWPPDVVHAAWTELTPMRVIVVEFATADAGRLLMDGRAVELTAPPASADGALAPEPATAPPDRESSEKEPW